MTLAAWMGSPMNYALDSETGNITEAKNASRKHSWICPKCRIKVDLVKSGLGNPFFRHWHGMGDPECEDYVGVSGSGPGPVAPVTKRPPLSRDEELLAWGGEEAATPADRPCPGETVLFAVDGDQLEVYVNLSPPVQLDLALFENAPELEKFSLPEKRLARSLRAAGLIVAVYDGFEAAFSEVRKAWQGEKVMMLGPEQEVEKQSEELRRRFRRTATSARMPSCYYPERRPGGHELVGLPKGWALIMAELPEDLDVSGLDWCAFSPYVIDGGWSWRRGVYFPGCPPAIRCASAGGGEWRALLDGVVDLAIPQAGGLELSSRIFTANGWYRIWLEGADMSVTIGLEAPPWNSDEWRVDPPAGGWHWHGAWPTPAVPVHPVSRIHGAWVEDLFVEPCREAAYGIGTTAPSLEMAWLRSCINSPDAVSRKSCNMNWIFSPHLLNPPFANRRK